MQKIKGISLIVLVITIVVMIILAGSIVLTLNNSGIIDKSSDAVEDSNLATVKQLAELAWADAYLEHGADAVKLDEAVRASLVANGITAQDYLGYDFRVTTEGVKLIKAHNIDVIPEGAVYYTNCSRECMVEDYEGATAIKAGEKFPTTPNIGDTYVYENYEYKYGCELYGPDFWNESSLEGWGVASLGDATTYRAVLESINNKPIKTMNFTFFNSAVTMLESDFIIPETVESCYGTFLNANQLTALPEGFTIPNGVNTTREMFSGSGITKLPKNFTIPSTYVDANMMFLNCSALSALPEGFKVGRETFAELMFSGCISLESLPRNFIVSSATSANGMFADCTSLGDVSGFTIESEDCMIEQLFFRCTSLTGTITINSNSDYIDQCFAETTKPITIKGTSKHLNQIASTSENGNVTVAE